VLGRFCDGFPFYLGSDGVKKREANAKDGADQQWEMEKE